VGWNRRLPLSGPSPSSLPVTAYKTSPKLFATSTEPRNPMSCLHRFSVVLKESPSRGRYHPPFFLSSHGPLFYKRLPIAPPSPFFSFFEFSGGPPSNAVQVPCASPPGRHRRTSDCLIRFHGGGLFFPADRAFSRSVRISVSV